MSFAADCATLPDHVANACNDYAKGGFPSIAVINQDHTITDWTNSSQWATNITSGAVKVIDRIKANIPENSEIKSDNPVACGAQQILDGFDWTTEWMDAQRSTFNDDFYKTLNKKEAFIVLWNKDESKIIVIDKPCTFVAKPVYPASNRENQHYIVKAEWTSSDDWFPNEYTAPTGVFTYST